MKIAIFGRKKDTKNYEHFFSDTKATPIVTLSLGDLASCDALLLPGGGDITPAFFGERNNGSRNIDTELDILQFQAFAYAYDHSLPILGICKGMQIINVALGGTLIQDSPTAAFHRYQNADQYHATLIAEHSCLFSLYGSEITVNSAHHQAVNKIGAGLTPIQWCPIDNCIEALVHETQPVLGVQWHPERIQPKPCYADGFRICSLFLSWIG